MGVDHAARTCFVCAVRAHFCGNVLPPLSDSNCTARADLSLQNARMPTRAPYVGERGERAPKQARGRGERAKREGGLSGSALNWCSGCSTGWGTLDKHPFGTRIWDRTGCSGSTTRMRPSAAPTKINTSTEIGPAQRDPADATRSASVGCNVRAAHEAKAPFRCRCGAWWARAVSQAAAGRAAFAGRRDAHTGPLCSEAKAALPCSVQTLCVAGRSAEPGALGWVCIIACCGAREVYAPQPPREM